MKSTEIDIKNRKNINTGNTPSYNTLESDHFEHRGGIWDNALGQATIMPPFY